MKLVIDISATDKTQAAVTSLTDTTAVTALQNLLLGDSEPLDLTFTDSSTSPAAAPSWAGAAGYTPFVALGTLDVNGALAHTRTVTFTAQTAGWTGRLALDTQALINACSINNTIGLTGWAAMATDPRSRNSRQRQAQFFLQIAVIDPSGNLKTYANLPVFVVNRVLPGTVGTDNSSTSAVYAYLAANAVLNKTLTGIASNVLSTTALCGLATANGATPSGQKILVSFPNNIEALFELVATTSTIANYLFAPYDYNASTNAYKWRLRGVFSLGSACVPDSTGANWYAPVAVSVDGIVAPALAQTAITLPA